jgi:uncharacterized membrane protein
VENLRRFASTVQTVRAIGVSFAWHFAHSEGVNCLISEIFAEGWRVNKFLDNPMD